jgi:hypothetical protein
LKLKYDEAPSQFAFNINLRRYTEGGDDGEPIPSELGTLIEPVMDAKLAYEKASVVRRRMYEKWLRDKNMLTEDMVGRCWLTLSNRCWNRLGVST